MNAYNVKYRVPSILLHRLIQVDRRRLRAGYHGIEHGTLASHRRAANGRGLPLRRLLVRVPGALHAAWDVVSHCDTSAKSSEVSNRS